MMQVKGFKSSKRFWIAFLVFLVAAAYSYATYHTYSIPMLTVRYSATEKAVVKVYWDSGSGFNDRECRSYELYAGSNERTDLPLPREKIFAVRLAPHNCSINKLGVYDWSRDGKIITLNVQRNGSELSALCSPSYVAKGEVLMPVQIAFAALLALIFYVFASRINSYDRNWRSAITGFFRKNWRFWAMFGTLVAWWSVWLIAEWPAILTRDSYYFTLREIANLEFDGIAPVAYNLLVLALMQAYNSPAVVAISQIVAMAALSANVFAYCLKRGVKKIIVAVFFLLLLVSAPVAAYNIALIKDVPFSILIVFFSYIVYRLIQSKKDGGTIVFSNAELVLAGVCLAMLATVRYNGAMYIGLIPLALAVLRLLNRKSWFVFTLSAMLMFALVTYASHGLQKVSSTNVDLFFGQAAMIGPTFAVAAGSHDLSNDEKQVLSKALNYDEIKRLYTATPRPDNYKNMIINLLKLDPSELAEYKGVCWKLIRRHPFIALQDRLLMFAGALGLNDNVYILLDESRTHDGYVYWRPLESYKYDKQAGKESVVSAFFGRALTLVTTPPYSRYIFNTVPAFALLLFLLFSYRKRKASAWFAILILVNVPVLFLVLSTCEWRMYYYIYIGGFFALPLWLAETNNNKEVA